VWDQSVLSRTCGVSGWATCWTTTFGCDLLGDGVVAGAGTVAVVAVVVVLTGDGTDAAGCWTDVGGGCTAKYIFVGPSTPCFPVVACAIKQIYFRHCIGPSCC
jgi:hypothetical protein